VHRVGDVDEGGAVNDLLTALALVLVLEGALWAISPDGMKRAAVIALSMANQKLRTGGLIAAALGVFLVWLMRG
jgi:uncharacterized protein YjeT (DUF2065 family)